MSYEIYQSNFWMFPSTGESVSDAGSPKHYQLLRQFWRRWDRNDWNGICRWRVCINLKYLNELAVRIGSAALYSLHHAIIIWLHVVGSSLWVHLHGLLCSILWWPRDTVYSHWLGGKKKIVVSSIFRRLFMMGRSVGKKIIFPEKNFHGISELIKYTSALFHTWEGIAK